MINERYCNLLYKCYNGVHKCVWFSLCYSFKLMKNKLDYYSEKYHCFHHPEFPFIYALFLQFLFRFLFDPPSLEFDIFLNAWRVHTFTFHRLSLRSEGWCNINNRGESRLVFPNLLFRALSRTQQTRAHTSHLLNGLLGCSFTLKTPACEDAERRHPSLPSGAEASSPPRRWLEGQLHKL